MTSSQLPLGGKWEHNPYWYCSIETHGMSSVSQQKRCPWCQECFGRDQAKTVVSSKKVALVDPTTGPCKKCRISRTPNTDLSLIAINWLIRKLLSADQTGQTNSETTLFSHGQFCSASGRLCWYPWSHYSWVARAGHTASGSRPVVIRERPQNCYSSPPPFCLRLKLRHLLFLYSIQVSFLSLDLRHLIINLCKLRIVQTISVLVNCHFVSRHSEARLPPSQAIPGQAFSSSSLFPSIRRVTICTRPAWEVMVLTYLSIHRSVQIYVRVS